MGASGESSGATGIDGDQDDNNDIESGAVYVFTRNTANVWSQQSYVKASNTGGSDWFGLGVALSANGNTLAVGSFGEDSSTTGICGDQDDNNASSAGAVYLFSRNAVNIWSQQSYVKASNTSEDDLLGLSVALSADGNTLAVGAVGEDSHATGIDGNLNDNSSVDSGAVYLY